MKRFWKFLLVLAVPAVAYGAAALSGVPRAFFPALSALLIILLPLLLGAWFARRFRLGWGLFGVGALTFIGSQVLHIPFNGYVLNPLLARMGIEGMPSGRDVVIYGVALGLSAGVFEETARYLTMRFWRKDVRTWGKSLMLGAGHGGIEAILVGVYGFYILIQMIMLFGMGVEEVGALTGAERAQEVFNAVSGYWGSSWHDFFWSALERVSAVTFHLSASVLVYQCFKRKNILWLGAAILWHTLLDGLAVYGVINWGVVVTELTLLGIALLGLGIIFALREPLPEEDSLIIGQPAERPPQPREIQQIQITSEKLDESRYD
jgi:uncharacterized membrane protein YhfC